MKKTISLRPYLIAILFVVIGLLLSEYFLVRSIRKYFLDSLEQEYNNYAAVYSHSLTKTTEAYNIINESLEKRLLSASRTAARYSAELTNQSLMELAEILDVEEIYVYNSAGEIVYSTREEYLGWQAYPEHPVFEFMQSSAPDLVEDIRADSESGEYYKYGYVKLDDGRFVQLGIRAGLVENLLAAFEVDRIIEEIAGFQLVDHVSIIDRDFKVIASSDPSTVGSQMQDPAVQEAVSAGQTYSLLNLDHPHGELYEVYVPVYVGNEYVGVLHVGKFTEESAAIARKITALGGFLIAGFFLGLILIMLSNYKHNQQLVALAYSDSLTGLPNKTYLEEVLAEAVAKPAGGKGAVLMIHCRNLSEINSTYGFTAGDQILKAIAKKLADLECRGCQLFRFTANRFVFYVEGYQHREELADLAERISRVVEQSQNFIQRQLQLYIGIVELTGAERSVDALLTQASVALQHIESGTGTGKYAFYDSRMEAALHRQEIIAAEMAEFLSGSIPDTFYLVYQPKVSLSSGEIVGFEALARMNSPTLGPVSPGEFIPLAERQDLIIPFSYWVLAEACGFIQQLAAAGYPSTHTAVNISVAALLQPDFTKRVEEIIFQSGINPANLQLEITESVVIEDFDDMQTKLCSLRELGVTIALDDFGTGYSALCRLEELPIDGIKIDKSFIDKIIVNDGQTQIIPELIAMCHKLELEVTAEGVELEGQREFLAAAGCDVMQGFLYSRPLNAVDALAKLAKENWKESAL